MNETPEPKIYEWIEETERIEVPTKAPLPRQYDDRLVAFIDILGVTDLAKDDNRAEEVLTIVSQVRTYVIAECNQLFLNRKLDYIQIGDGFVIVTGLRQINRLCRILSSIQWRTLIESKMLLRGVITAGRVQGSMVEGFFIGPAIINAYKLERGNAIFPRIIYMDEIESHVSRKLIKFGYIIEDQDKIKYLDFIGHNCDTKKLSGKTLDHLLTTQGIKKMLKTEYERHIVGNDAENIKKAQKCGWVISKFADCGVKLI